MSSLCGINKLPSKELFLYNQVFIMPERSTPWKRPDEDTPKQDDIDQGGEDDRVTAKCTELCGEKRGGRSCAKICLANIYDRNQPDKKIKAYVIVDNQSNCSLAKSELFDQLGIHGEKTSCTLKTYSGTNVLDERRTKDLEVESSDGRKTHPLATVVECNAIADSKEEIPTLPRHTLTYDQSPRRYPSKVKMRTSCY